MRRKVLHVITGLARHGAQGALTNLIRGTGEHFDHVVVSLKSGGGYARALREYGVPVHSCGFSTLPSIVSATSSLFRLMGREKPDVVQTWLYHSDLVGGLAAKTMGWPPVIWTLRNCSLDAELIGLPTKLVAWMSARLSVIVPDAIVSVSHEALDLHRAFGYRADRMEVIPNGCDTARFHIDPQARVRFRSRLGVEENQILVGTVARWDPQKDHRTLVSALAEIVAEIESLRLLLVGEGMDSSNEPLRELLKSAGLDNHTILYGVHHDIPEVMNALDLHVLSSRGEAFPNVVAEAMACGTPCVVTNVGDAGRIVGDTGWIVEPGRIDELAGALRHAICEHSEEERRCLGARSRRRIVNEFSLSQMHSAYLRLWFALLGTEPSRQGTSGCA